MTPLDQDELLYFDKRTAIPRRAVIAIKVNTDDQVFVWCAGAAQAFFQVKCSFKVACALYSGTQPPNPDNVRELKE
jgi:hypothetical protein